MLSRPLLEREYILQSLSDGQEWPDRGALCASRSTFLVEQTMVRLRPSSGTQEDGSVWEDWKK